MSSSSSAGLMLLPKSFVSESHPNALPFNHHDLKQFFQKAANVIREKMNRLEGLDHMREVLVLVKHETVTTINHILKLYEYNDLITTSDEDVENWYKEDVDNDDERRISIRIMIIVFLYCSLYTKLVEELDTLSLLPFFACIEESISPRIVKYAKHMVITSSEKNQVESFEMNVEDMENWEQCIIHFYTLLQVDFTTWGKQSIYEFGQKGCSSLSCFTMLSMLKYFSEKKAKFFMENTSGQMWQLRERDRILLRLVLLFWSVFQEFMERHSSEDDSSDEEDDEDTINITKRKHPHGLNAITINNLKHFYRLTFISYNQLISEIIYDLSEIPNTDHKVKDETVDVANSVLVYLSSAKQTSAKLLKSLIEKDYEEVKCLDNSSIITDLKSKNCGKYAWIVKHKILSTICLILEELCSSCKELSKLEFALDFLFPFGDFVIETLNYTGDSQFDAELRRMATLTSLSLCKLSLSGNARLSSSLFIKQKAKYENHKQFLPKFTNEILSIWKKNLYSTDEPLRENTCFSLSVYFTDVHESRITDDLIECVIKSCEANISNMSQYSILLSALIDKIEYSDSPFVDDFRMLLTRLFEIICKGDGMAYLANSNISEEKKVEMHKQNIIFYFETLHDSYDYIKIGFQFDPILSYIKEKIEEMWKSGTFQSNIQIVSSCVVCMKQIFTTTKLDTLQHFAMEKNYFTFLSKLIRSCILTNCPDISRGPIFQFIGNLSNIGFLELCPFDDDDDKDGENLVENVQTKHFIYDFILPAVIEEALPPGSFFTDQIIIDDNNLPKRIDSLTQSSWALGRIMYNDLMRTGGDRSQDIFFKSIDKFQIVVKYLTNYDFYTTEDIRNLLLGYQDKILISGLLMIQPRLMEKLASQFGKILSTLCEVVGEEIIDMNQDSVFLLFSILKLTEYLLDYYPSESLPMDELAVFFAPIMALLLLECNPFQSAEAKRIFNKIVLVD